LVAVDGVCVQLDVDVGFAGSPAGVAGGLVGAVGVGAGVFWLGSPPTPGRLARLGAPGAGEPGAAPVGAGDPAIGTLPSGASMRPA
jgi:hypothetical protein